jgi:nitroreductase
MNFYELAKARYSLRDMSDQKIADEDLKKILEAGRIAPTAKNSQSQRILVIRGDAALQKMRECTPSHFNAPVICVVSYDTKVSGTCNNPIGGESYGEVDAAIVATHMMLQATELGIGSSMVATFDTDQMRQVFHFPETIKPVILLLLGYPGEKGQPGVFHERRFKLKKTVAFDDYKVSEQSEELC